jgi:acyl-coenzyme A thioesterase PaaI-like protein
MIGASTLGCVPDSYFTLIEQGRLDARYASGPATVGPWNPGLQHGGPPNALAVAAAERAVFAETGRTDLVALRLASEFVGPVPVTEVTTRARVVRAARSAALAEVVLAAGDRDCLHARVWFVRQADTASVADALDEPGVRVVQGAAGGLAFDFPYGQSIEWRFVHGRMEQSGPSAAWARPRLALVDDYEYSGLARAAVIADSGNGISAVLDWAEWTFVNVDLDVHLARPMHGEWLLLDAVTQVGPAGSALARSTLSDTRGVLGAGLQTLVVAPIRR